MKNPGAGYLNELGRIEKLLFKMSLNSNAKVVVFVRMTETIAKNNPFS